MFTIVGPEANDCNLELCRAAGFALYKRYVRRRKASVSQKGTKGQGRFLGGGLWFSADSD